MYPSEKTWTRNEISETMTSMSADRGSIKMPSERETLSRPATRV
jgi:hypothetical protein